MSCAPAEVAVSECAHPSRDPGRPCLAPQELVGRRCHDRQMGLFLVTLQRSGPSYSPGLALEEQHGWTEHAAFMDGLVDVGVVVLGGPLDDDHRVVLVV